MHRLHRWLCRSDRWRSILAQSLPWAIGNTDLGPSVLEIGPRPGLPTDLLRTSVAQLTALEIDASLAGLLSSRLKGSNVQVFKGDAAKMSFEDSEYSGAVSFTVLHHIPSRELQDAVFDEVFRVLGPGGFFCGLRQSLELVYEDHSYRRHPGSHKSRYFRRMIGECGF